MKRLSFYSISLLLLVLFACFQCNNRNTEACHIFTYTFKYSDNDIVEVGSVYFWGNNHYYSVRQAELLDSLNAVAEAIDPELTVQITHEKADYYKTEQDCMAKNK